MLNTPLALKANKLISSATQFDFFSLIYFLKNNSGCTGHNFFFYFEWFSKLYWSCKGYWFNDWFNVGLSKFSDKMFVLKWWHYHKFQICSFRWFWLLHVKHRTISASVNFMTQPVLAL